MDALAIGIALVVAAAILSPSVVKFFRRQEATEPGCGSGCAGCPEASASGPDGCSSTSVVLQDRRKK